MKNTKKIEDLLERLQGFHVVIGKADDQFKKIKKNLEEFKIDIQAENIDEVDLPELLDKHKEVISNLETLIERTNSTEYKASLESIKDDYQALNLEEKWSARLNEYKILSYLQILRKELLVEQMKDFDSNFIQTIVLKAGGNIKDVDSVLEHPFVISQGNDLFYLDSTCRL